MTRKVLLIALAVLFCSSLAAQAALTNLTVTYPDGKNWDALYGAAELTQGVVVKASPGGSGLDFSNTSQGVTDSVLDTVGGGIHLAPNATQAIRFQANAANQSSQGWDPVQTGRLFAWDKGTPATQGAFPYTPTGGAAKSANFTYKLNVGWAKKVTKLGKAKQLDYAVDSVNFDKSTVLSAYVAGGTVSKLASGMQTGNMVDLMSKVGNGVFNTKHTGQAGTLAEVTTTAAEVLVAGKTGWLKSNGSPKPYVFNKKVGSDAQILAANYTGTETVSPEMDVTMAWRHRLIKENGSDTGQPLPVAPGSGIAAKWLTSDIVKIGGIGEDVSYALQMTFDNRINLALEADAVKGDITKQISELYIAQLNTTTDVWEKIALVSGSPGGQGFMSLDDFLTANSGMTLDQLEGSWGVDPSYDARQRGKSWAIVKGGGSGIFAVVPEPATVLMMISAALGAMTYGWRRWSRKPELSA